MYSNCLYCVLCWGCVLFSVFSCMCVCVFVSVRCSLYSVLFCSLCCMIVVSVFCILCMCVSCICVLCWGVCVYCVRILCVREVFGWGWGSTQSDTPHVGYLCGYMVRIIKYKKTQPLIKLKSIWFSKFLLCFKIMLLLSEKVSIKWNVLPDNINRLQPKKTGKNGIYLI